MKARLKNHKANNDGSVTVYLDKGADEFTLLSLRGKQITIEEARAEGEPEVKQITYEQACEVIRQYGESREKQGFMDGYGEGQKDAPTQIKEE